MRTFFYIIFTTSILILKAIVLFQLWAWFISPYFNLPTLTFLESFGIILIHSLLSFLPLYDFRTQGLEIRHNITIGVKPLILLVFGWFIHFFM